MRLAHGGLAVALVMNVCPTRAATAQKAIAPAACSFDTAAHRDTVPAMVSVAAYVDGDTVMNYGLSMSIGAMIRGQFHAPGSIGALFYPNVGPHAPGSLAGWSAGTFAFSLAHRKTVSDLRWVEPTPDSATNIEVLRALRAALDSDPQWSREVEFMIEADHVIRVEVLAVGSGNASPLLRLPVAILHIDNPAMLVAAVAPRFPPGFIGRTVKVNVELEFLVDENGHAVRGSVRVLSHPDKAFVASAIEAVMAATFKPATSGGCPVKSRVEQTIRYNRGGK